MNYRLPFLMPLGSLAAVVMALAPGARAETRNFSLPAYRTHPGGILEVPLTLDNAAGLAAIEVQVNFNPNVLELLAVKPGPLGEAFDLSEGEGDGFVRLTFFRGDSLAGGSGRLAALRFRANSGADISLYSELAIAELNLADDTGVIDLRQKDEITTSNGEVAVSAQTNIDNTGSGLPDWWEALHDLDPFASNLELDPDADGVSNLLEYAFGGNPQVPDARERGLQAGSVEQQGATFLSLGFFRRPGDSTLRYLVQESTDLDAWRDLTMPYQLVGPPLDMGDGTEFVKMAGTLPVTGPDAAPTGFMRVKVEKE
jgi:hypothetical protein